MAHWAGRRCQLATAHGTKWTDSTKNCVDGLLRLFLYIPHLGFQGLIFGFFGFAKGSFRNRKFGTTTRAPPKKGAQSLLVCCFVPKLWGKTLIQSWEGVGGLSLVSFTSSDRLLKPEKFHKVVLIGWWISNLYMKNGWLEIKSPNIHTSMK